MVWRGLTFRRPHFRLHRDGQNGVLMRAAVSFCIEVVLMVMVPLPTVVTLSVLRGLVFVARGLSPTP